jgi:hypothetical protein
MISFGSTLPWVREGRSTWYGPSTDTAASKIPIRGQSVIQDFPFSLERPAHCCISVLEIPTVLLEIRSATSPGNVVNHRVGHLFPQPLRFVWKKPPTPIKLQKLGVIIKREPIALMSYLPTITTTLWWPLIRRSCCMRGCRWCSDIGFIYQL